ncbi:MAG: amidohydrolase [Saprospiraceae bacterium]|uniref:Amidohydrolase n=1 Tax=Candidatus Defluviibacterium haderslevense TaxID=2981993 RepID=A0A9D7XEN4_9BACT|nr:amidohydrolase [Candidatus Defluviibacterium haderslevense]
MSKVLNVSFIKSLIATHEREFIQIRRDLHQYPELSFDEKNTSLKIQSLLSLWNIDFTAGWAGYGIVGTLVGEKTSSEIIALRADMDALPIQETTNEVFSSQNKGIMHACGHDIHTTCLLAALKVLKTCQSDWGGTVKFIFQPAEEKLPGGASIMIKEGVLLEPRPSVIIGQHVQPKMPVGSAGICAGLSMASCDELYITIKGKGGHAALPHLAVDPIQIAAQVILGLQTLITREKPPIVNALLSFGKINTTGGATNIIPDEVRLEGTFRAMDEEFRNYAHQRIHAIVNEICEAYQGTAEITLDKGYPSLINDTSASIKWNEYASEYIGIQNVAKVPPRMTSEDFSYYSQHIPACFYRLGVGETTQVHTSSFNPDEGAIAEGAGLLTWLALRFLGNT